MSLVPENSKRVPNRSLTSSNLDSNKPVDRDSTMLRVDRKVAMDIEHARILSDHDR
ncbi:MAG: hypothetical protein V3W41_09125 [Planctomycetota bacterium]